MITKSVRAQCKYASLCTVNINISPCHLHTHISYLVWIWEHSPRLTHWVPSSRANCQKEKGLIELVCANGHKRTRQEFRGKKKCIQREVIWRSLPLSQQWWRQGRGCVVSSSPIHFITLGPISLCEKPGTSARQQASGGQAKQWCSVKKNF